VGADDRRGDRQAEPRAAALAGARRVGPVEALEHLVQLFGRQAATVIDDGELRPRAARRRAGRRERRGRDAERQLDRRARGRVHAGVGDHVGHGLRQPVAVADDGARFGVDRDRAVGLDDSSVGSQAFDHGAQVERMALEG
jgi:hypothetical protein